MRMPDYADALQPDEVAFWLITNSSIDAGRFVVFLESFLYGDHTRRLPPFSVQIAELRTGSIFARLQFLFSSEEDVDGRIEQLERDVAELRQAATIRAAASDHWQERQTIAAEGQLQIAKAGLHTNQYLAALATLTLVLGYAEYVRADVHSQPGQGTTAVIEQDGVSAVEMYCSNGAVIITRGDVAMIRRRDEAEQSTGSRDKAEFPRDRSEGPIPSRFDVILTNPRAPHAITPDPSSVVTPASSPGPAAQSRASIRTNSREAGRAVGIIRRHGEAYEMTIEEPPRKGEVVTILFANVGDLEDGKRYRLKGTFYGVDGGQSLFAVDRWYPYPGGESA